LFLFSIQQLSCQTQFKKTVSYLSSTELRSNPKRIADSLTRDFITTQFINSALKPIQKSIDFNSRFLLINQCISGDCKILSDNKYLDYTIGQDFFFSYLSKLDTIFSDLVFIGFGDGIKNLIDKDKEILLNNKAVIVYNSFRGFDSKTTAWVSANMFNTPEDLQKVGAKALMAVLPQDYKITYPNYAFKPSKNKNIIYMFISFEMFRSIVGDQTIETSKERLNQRQPFSAQEIKNKKIKISTIDLQKADTLYNIVGSKQGLTDQTIIIGAHYDHITGKNPSYSSYPGANDNSSGVSMLIEIANKIKSEKLKNSIIFVAFGAEEKGLYGSKNFLETYPYDKSKIKAMINLDMVGCLKGDSLHYELQNTKEFKDIMTKTSIQTNNKLILGNSKLGLSDSYTFKLNDIPTIYLSTGDDPFLHTELDTEDKINYSGMDLILDFITTMIKELDHD
jgi:hypothetical protein